MDDPITPGPSHDWGLFQGMDDSRGRSRSAGEELAHPPEKRTTTAAAPTPSKRRAKLFVAFVDDIVAGLNRDVAGIIADDVGNRAGRFHRSDLDLADELSAPFDEHFCIVHDAVSVAKAENHEVPSRIHCENSTFEARSHLQLLAVVGLFPVVGNLRFARRVVSLKGSDERFLLGQLALEIGDLGRGPAFGSVGTGFEFLNPGVLGGDIGRILSKRRVFLSELGGLFSHFGFRCARFLIGGGKLRGQRFFFGRGGGQFLLGLGQVRFRFGERIFGGFQRALSGCQVFLGLNQGAVIDEADGGGSDGKSDGEIEEDFTHVLYAGRLRGDELNGINYCGKLEFFIF